MPPPHEEGGVKEGDAEAVKKKKTFCFHMNSAPKWCWSPGKCGSFAGQFFVGKEAGFRERVLMLPASPADGGKTGKGLDGTLDVLVMKLFVDIQSLSSIQLFVTPWTAAHQTSHHHLPELT